MLKPILMLAGAAVIITSAAWAQQSPDPAPVQPDVPKICQYVVSAQPDAKPEQLCLTKAEWDAKKLADARDPNRMVCHYEDSPGTRLRSRKICMTSNEWAEQRRLEREAVDKIQQSVCVAGAGC